MKVLSIKILIICLISFSMTACSSKDDLSGPLVGLGGDPITKSKIDKWLYDSLTVPFNIEIKYKWDPYEINTLTWTMVPPEEDKVIPLMETLKKVFILSYIQAKDSNFMRTFVPKQYILSGRSAFDPSDGTKVAGLAEGGKKILLFDVNVFDIRDKDVTKKQLHTIEHEFAHILHQTNLYPPAYKTITPGDYTANWYNVDVTDANNKGFITSYAMLNTDEDFAEMVSIMLVYGKIEFDALVNTIADNDGRDAIREKEKIIVAYYKQYYNIDFYQLQQLKKIAIDNL